MTVWNRPLSWSKVSIALKCPLQLQYTLDKKPHGKYGDGYHQALGTLTQLVFELWYNQGINLKSGGRTPEVIDRICTKIFESQRFRDYDVSYPHTKSEEDLKADVRRDARTGFEHMEKMGLTKLKVRSEVKWHATFRGLRLFCLIDFIREGKSGIWLFDGKGHGQKNADPKQLLHYALAIAASGKTLAGGGLIYWKHGFEKVDVSPKAVKGYVDEVIVPLRPMFEELKHGIQGEMEAKPHTSVCVHCNWRFTCPHSVMKPEERSTYDTSDVQMGEV